MDNLKDYISTDSRHNLLFMSLRSHNITYVDIGEQLSKKLELKIESKRIAMIADDAIETIINSNLTSVTGIGNVIAITNIGILFEPKLKLDLKAKIDSWAKSFILIIDSHEGLIRDNTFYLAGDTNFKNSINLKDISHKTIYDEI